MFAGDEISLVQLACFGSRVLLNEVNMVECNEQSWMVEHCCSLNYSVFSCIC